MALPPSLDIDEGSVTPSGRIVPTYARQIAYRPGSSAVTSEQSPPRNNRRYAWTPEATRRRPFETYIEVQLWADAPIQEFLAQ
jgi:hypothetical protein